MGGVIVIRRIGDVVSDAAARLSQAGYSATCGHQTTDNLGGRIEQDVCSIPGYPQGFDASLTLGLSVPQIQAILSTGRDANAQTGWIGTTGGQQDSRWSNLVTVPAASSQRTASGSPAKQNQSTAQPQTGITNNPWLIPVAAAALFLIGGRL